MSGTSAKNASESNRRSSKPTALAALPPKSQPKEREVVVKRDDFEREENDADARDSDDRDETASEQEDDISDRDEGGDNEEPLSNESRVSQRTVDENMQKIEAHFIRCCHCRQIWYDIPRWETHVARHCQRKHANKPPTYAVVPLKRWSYCIDCGKVFQLDHALARHKPHCHELPKQAQQKGPVSYKCSACGRIRASRSSIASHFKSSDCQQAQVIMVHENEMEHCVPGCDRPFPTSHLGLLHKRTCDHWRRATEKEAADSESKKRSFADETAVTKKRHSTTAQAADFNPTLPSTRVIEKPPPPLPVSPLAQLSTALVERCTGELLYSTNASLYQALLSETKLVEMPAEWALMLLRKEVTDICQLRATVESLLTASGMSSELSRALVLVLAKIK